MFVIDLHNDWSDNCLYLTHKNFFEENSLKSGRNMLGWGVVNQVDLPRLKKGNVKLVFGASCIMPKEMEMDLNIKRFFLSNHLDFYDYIVKNSNGEIKKILKFEDLKEIFEEKNKIGLLMHIEGFYFCGENDNFYFVDEVYKRGVRSIGLTWNLENNLAGGAKSKKGLSELGKAMIKYLNQKGIILDLAHINEKSFWDIMEINKKPVMISHTQLKKFKNIPRNISDEQIKAVAEVGGIIGLTPLRQFIGEKGDYKINLESYIQTIEHLLEVGGENVIAMGSDFDGFISPEDVIEGFGQSSDFVNLVNELEKRGWKSSLIEKLMWKNAYNFVGEIL